MSGESDDSVGRLNSTKEYLRSLFEQRQPDTVLLNAWDQFYDLYDQVIRRFVTSFRMSRVDAADCSQTVWLHVLTSLQDFKPHGQRSGLRAWLHTLVQCRAADIVRSTIRRPTKSLDQALEAGDEPVSLEWNPARMFEAEWNQALVESVMDGLKEEETRTNRLIMQRRLIERCPAETVAAELGLSTQAVRNRQERLMKRIRVRIGLLTGEPLGTMAAAPPSRS